MQKLGPRGVRRGDGRRQRARTAWARARGGQRGVGIFRKRSIGVCCDGSRVSVCEYSGCPAFLPACVRRDCECPSGGVVLPVAEAGALRRVISTRIQPLAMQSWKASFLSRVHGAPEAVGTRCHERPARTVLQPEAPRRRKQLRGRARPSTAVAPTAAAGELDSAAADQQDAGLAASPANAQ